MLDIIKSDWKAKLTVLLFLVLSAWWIYIQLPQQKNSMLFEIYGVAYGLLALVGALWGFIASSKWGGFKSILGKAISFFALGLLAQEFGQVTYFYYVFFLHIEVPYPSIGDLGYFGSIPLYILGIIYLAKASGVKISLKNYISKLQAIIIPLIILGVGYFLFLREYSFSEASSLQAFLDFGYPLGQAIYISLALLTYLLSRNILGGIMRNKILFILFALLLQFLADYTFLYQTSRDTWTPHGINDYMYQLAYFIMAFALLRLDSIAKKLRE